MLAVGASGMENYKELGKIGEGTFSEVLKCENLRDGSFVAVKRMKSKFSRCARPACGATGPTQARCPPLPPRRAGGGCNPPIGGRTAGAGGGRGGGGEIARRGLMCALQPGADE